MADSLTVRFPNLREFQRNLRQLPRQLSADILEAAVGAAADEISAAIEIRAPRGETGRLLRSIRKRTHVKTAAAVEMSVGPRARYAHLQEYGHRLVRGGRVVGHVPARPFVRPAVDETRDRALQRISDVLALEIERAFVKVGVPV